jgi:membrane-bound lytic murein transglycosylase B
MCRSFALAHGIIELSSTHLREIMKKASGCNTFWLRSMVALLGGVMMVAAAFGQGYLQNKDFQHFLSDMENKHHFNRSELVMLFAEVQRQDRIIELMMSPAERTKTWGEYRPIFVNQMGIDRGTAFWAEHHETLMAASRQYNVPPEIIVAIIGVETRYGRIKGSFRVIDALTTLAFSYPPRAEFFREELGHFLLLKREHGLPLERVKGSYAGAMGYPQFIPSSYRSYAVDFNQDGRTDLVNSVEDAIGSVGHYFQRHGWQANKVVVRQVSLSAAGQEPGVAALANNSREPNTTVAALRKAGLQGLDTFPGDLPAALFRFDNDGSIEYWAGFENFYVITRYNHSRLYALAVYQLAEVLRDARQKNGAD